MALLGAATVGCSQTGGEASSPATGSVAPQLREVDVARLQEANARLDAAHPSGPVRERYRHPPVDRTDLDVALDRIAPLHVPDEVTHLLRHGGWWPGALSAPELEGYFEDAVRYGSDPAVRTTWMSFARTWDQDVCFAPLLDRPFSAAPLGLWSTQMLQVSVPAPSVADLLAAFEIALEVLELTDRGLENPTWVDLITTPPRRDRTVEEATYRRQVVLHERLEPLAATWTSDHPCWVAGEMPMGWTDEPSNAVADALLRTGS